MKIQIRPPNSPYKSTLDTGVNIVILSDVFNGVGIETDQGHFGIAQRDQGIEVLLNGVHVWGSTDALGNAPVDRDELQAAMNRQRKRSAMHVAERDEARAEVERLRAIEVAVVGTMKRWRDDAGYTHGSEPKDLGGFDAKTYLRCASDIERAMTPVQDMRVDNYWCPQCGNWGPENVPCGHCHLMGDES